MIASSQSTAIDQSLRDIRRGRSRRRARKVRGTQPADTAPGKRGNPSVRALQCVLRGPRLGRDSRDPGRRRFQRRSSSRGGFRPPEGRDAAIAEIRHSPRSGSRPSTTDTIATRGRAPLPESYPILREVISRSDAFQAEVLTSSRSTSRSESRRSSCSISTTSTPPWPSSMPDTSPGNRPPTRTCGPSSPMASPRCAGTSCRRPRPMCKYRPPADGCVCPG